MSLRIMLATSYAGGNYANAIHTLQLYRDYFLRKPKPECCVVLGLETLEALYKNYESAPVTPLRTLLQIRDQRWTEIYYWDGSIDSFVRSQLPPDLPKPFFASFSYGAALNRMLVLSKLANCEYMVRVDPGTRPPENFWDIIEQNIEQLNSGKALVISGRYEDRLAVRDDYVYKDAEKLKRYYNFIKEMTGIDPQSQVTGGGAFAVRVPGIPAIPFEPYKLADGSEELTLVWGSDDALFQIYPPRGAIPDDTAIIPRHDKVGYPKSPKVYFSGIAGMVHFRAVLDGKGSATRESVDEFIDSLNQFLDPRLPVNKGQLPLTPQMIRSEFLQKIEEGYRNFSSLRERWLEVLSRIESIVRENRIQVSF